jgi:RNA polymerase sigma factor (sigma-70 family)
MNTEGTTVFIGGTSMAMPASDDRGVLAGLRDLDSQAISAVYDRYFRDIYRYIFYRIGDQAAAEDLTGDVFVRLLEAVQKRRGPETNIKGWLLSTASHVVMDHLRRRYRRPVESISDTLRITNPAPTDIDRRAEPLRKEAYAHLRSSSRMSALRFGEDFRRKLPDR